MILAMGMVVCKMALWTASIASAARAAAVAALVAADVAVARAAEEAVAAKPIDLIAVAEWAMARRLRHHRNIEGDIMLNVSSGEKG